MIAGLPHVIPPWQIDPHQTPRRNRRHRLPKATRRTVFSRPDRG